MFPLRNPRNVFTAARELLPVRACLSRNFPDQLIFYVPSKVIEKVVRHWIFSCPLLRPLDHQNIFHFQILSSTTSSPFQFLVSHETKTSSIAKPQKLFITTTITVTKSSKMVSKHCNFPPSISLTQLREEVLIHPASQKTQAQPSRFSSSGRAGHQIFLFPFCNKRG